MKKPEYENPLQPINSEDILRSDLLRLESIFESKDFLTKSVDADGEIIITPFYPPIELLFKKYLTSSNLNHWEDRHEAWGQFYRTISRFYNNEPIYSYQYLESEWKSKILSRFRGNIRGFINFLGTDSANNELEKYYQSPEYLTDYANYTIQHHHRQNLFLPYYDGYERIDPNKTVIKIPNLKFTQSIENQSEITTSLIHGISDLLSSYPQLEVVNLESLVKDVWRTQVNLAIFVGVNEAHTDTSRAYLDISNDVLTVLKERYLGEFIFDDLHDEYQDRKSGCKFMYEGTFCSVFVADAFATTILKPAIRLLTNDPSLRARFNKLLLHQLRFDEISTLFGVWCASEKLLRDLEIQ